MNPNSVEFIYKAINAIASGKHDLMTEQCLSDAIEEELFLLNATLVLAPRHERIVLPAQVEVQNAA